MTTAEMYAMLDDEYRAECDATWKQAKEYGHDTPEEYKAIVSYYYNEQQRPPEGWFQWWED